MNEPSTHQVVIVGSGPAGLTAAIYAARANLKPLCIEGFSAGGLIPGGQLMFTSDVENFPGFPTHVSGQELMARMREQAEKQGAELVTEDVSRLDLTARPFRIALVTNDRPLQFSQVSPLGVGAAGGCPLFVPGRPNGGPHLTRFWPW